MPAGVCCSLRTVDLSSLFFFKDLSRPTKIGRCHTLSINAAVVAAEKNVDEEDAVVEEVTLVENGNGDFQGCRGAHRRRLD